MSPTKETLVIGLGGHVVALAAATGTELWRTRLRSTGAQVTVWDAGSQVYAGVNGELYCLSPHTGEIRWHNRLKGLGLGLIAFGATSDVVVAAAIKAARDAAAASG